MSAPAPRRKVTSLRRTIAILHALATLGVVEQVIDEECRIRWRAKGSKKKFDRIMRALRG